MHRRSFLKSAGIVTVAVAGGTVWRARETGVFRAGEGPAFEPWTHWRAEPADGPLALVRAGILASNPFNTQPWLFQVTESRINVYADNARNTGAFDPYLRELRIGLGCAVENMMLAAAANAYRATLTLTPSALGPAAARPPRELVARIDLEQGLPHETELYLAIPNRRTNRYPYDAGKPVPAEFVSALHDAVSDEPDVRVQLYTADADRTRIVGICTQAVMADIGNPDVRSGTARWSRDWQSMQQLRDGSSLDESGQPALAVAAAKFFPAPILALLQGTPGPDIATRIKHGYSDLLMTGRLFGVIAVRDPYDQALSVRAGRVWQRSHLLATARGVAARPINQPVQLADHERLQQKPPQQAAQLTGLTGDPAWRPTFMYFMGYPTHPANPSARRGVEAVVL